MSVINVHIADDMHQLACLQTAHLREHHQPVSYTHLDVYKRQLEKLRDELNLNIEKLYERVQTGEAQIKTIRLERQRIYRRSYHSETIAERMVALRNTALEAMHAYGTDTTRRMYFTEYPITAKAEVSFCVAIPPESEGEFIEWTESMPCLLYTSPERLSALS